MKRYANIDNLTNITPYFRNSKHKAAFFGHGNNAKEVIALLEKISCRKFISDKDTNVTFTILSVSFPGYVVIAYFGSNDKKGTYVHPDVAELIKTLLEPQTIPTRSQKSEIYEKVGKLFNDQLGFSIDIYNSHEDPRFRAGDVALQLWAANNKGYPRMEKLNNALNIREVPKTEPTVQSSDFITMDQLRMATLKSNSPKAQPLYDFLVEVMRSIDKYGCWPPPAQPQIEPTSDQKFAIQDLITNPDLLIRIGKELKEGQIAKKEVVQLKSENVEVQKQLNVANITIEKKDDLITDLKQKLENYSIFENGIAYFTPTDIVKGLDLPLDASELNQFAVDEKIQYRVKGQDGKIKYYELTKDASGYGYAWCKPKLVGPKTKPWLSKQLVWTIEGVKFLLQRLRQYAPKYDYLSAINQDVHFKCQENHILKYLRGHDSYK